VSVQARPQEYAAAIYDLALESWSSQLKAVQGALKSNDALRATLDDAGTSTRDKLEALDRSLPGGLSRDVRRFVGTLIEAGQLDQLGAILVEFGRLSQRQPERRIARVTSAVKLTADEEQAMRAKLTERFGDDLEFQFDVDPGLIGGIYLRVGDQVIDGTVAGKLAALRTSLAA
jgi:F-type H+-transporting ATPase subunit delta